MVLIDNLAEKIFGILKGLGYQIKLYTNDGTETIDPATARRFFVYDPGLMVTIDELENDLQLSKEESDKLEHTEKLQKNLRNLANQYLMNYSVRNYGKTIRPRDFSFKAKIHKEHTMDNINEGFTKLSGSKKTSYQVLEDVKILVKHRVAVDETKRGARSRNIQSIFLEKNGERFKLPCNNLHGARAMARHMHEGGNMHDAIGTYIIESVQNAVKLREFVNYAMRNKLINEGTSDVIAVVRNNILQLKESLSKLTGAKTYPMTKARIEESEGPTELVEDDVMDLQDQFTVKKFDEKFAGVLPLVKYMVNEQENYLNRIQDAASQTIQLLPESDAIVLEFTSASAEMAHKISSLSNRIVENDELSHYISTLGHKIGKSQPLSMFETKVLQATIENAKVGTVINSTHGEVELKESRLYEGYFNKYIYAIVK